MRLKKYIPKNNFFYLGDYKWPTAFDALKAFFIFCIYKSKNKNYSLYVSESFIRDVINELFDDEIALITEHPQKNELSNINNVSFNDLLKSNPKLIQCAFTKNQ